MSDLSNYADMYTKFCPMFSDSTRASPMLDLRSGVLVQDEESALRHRRQDRDYEAARFSGAGGLSWLHGFASMFP